MNIEKLTESESLVLSSFLEGDTRELNLLRFQLDDVKAKLDFVSRQRSGYLSRLLQWLSIQSKAEVIKREPGITHFSVGSGFGSEDWELGDRRIMVLDDVIAKIADGSYLCFQLIILYGVIYELRVIGRTLGPMLPIKPIPFNTSEFVAEEVHFVDRTNQPIGIGYRSIVDCRLASSYLEISPPANLAFLSDRRHWLLDFDTIAIRVAGSEIPLGIRRAIPATTKEIYEIETKYEITLPNELRDFWLTSNGAAFLGRSLCGTYDTQMFQWNKAPTLLLIGGFYEDCTTLVCCVGNKPDETTELTRVLQIDWTVKRVDREWDSLKKCLYSLLDETTNAAIATVPAQDTVKDISKPIDAEGKP